MLYQVTVDGKVVSEHANGYDATMAAVKIRTRKVVTIRRTDGKAV